VEVEVTDDKGNRCPTALNMIHFTMEGPAEWRGGIAQGPDNYILSKSLPVEGGVNRVFIRSTMQTGHITVKAASDDLQEAVLILVSKPFANENGLSMHLPAAGLPAYLERGTTPLVSSYNITRTPVAIVNATAGANSDKAYASYDDNEKSGWANDGRLVTAWIEYELEREAAVSEIVLKLNKFRTQVYPLHITIDNQEVFNGITEKNLGYNTLVCQPKRGKKVKIQLAGNTKENEGNITAEISGKKLDDGVAYNVVNTTGTLSIIEIEIYEAKA
jgi:beta-galactosidase